MTNRNGLSILNIDTENKIQLDPQILIAQRIAVLGISGSGKSNTAAVLTEELLPHLQMTIVDIEGEMYGLKEKFDLIVAGRSRHVDLELAPYQGAAIAEFIWMNGLSVVLDISDYDKEEQTELLLSYFETLWKLADAQPRPHTILLEEAHEFIPQGGGNELKTLFTRFAARGRKRGIGMIYVSQRSAKVNKDTLTQAGTFFLHRVSHPTDLAIYKDFIPLPAKEVEKIIRGLTPGQAVVVSSEAPQTVQIRKRHTFHAGATPLAAGADMPTFQALSPAILDGLKKSLAQVQKLKPNHVTGKDELVAIQQNYIEDLEAQRNKDAKRIKELELALAEKTHELENARKQIRLLEQRPMEIQPVAVQPALLVAEADETYRKEVTTTVVEYRSSRAVTIAVNAQQRGFERFLGQLQALQPRHKKMLGLMLGNEATIYQIGNLAVRLDLSVGRTQEAARELFRLGLLRRITAQRYQPIFTAHFREQYPDLETDALLEKFAMVVQK